MSRREHPLVVALVEAYARRSDIAPDDLWAYVDRKKSPPPAVRDAIVAAFFPRVPPDSFLPSGAENDTFDTMNATETDAARRGRPIGQRKHPFVAALLADGLTVAELSVELRRSESSIKSWYKDPSDAAFRPIPAAIAEKIRKRFGKDDKGNDRVPLSAWSRIAE